MNQQHWKRKVHHFFRDCQSEFKRTTEIGRKMLSASKTSSTLRDAYEELGQILEKEVDKGNNNFTHPRIMDLLAIVKACKNDLEHIEGEMNRIRFSEGVDGQTPVKMEPDSSKSSVNKSTEK